MSEAITLLEQAAKCRRLAAFIRDQAAHVTLLALAVECETKALAVQDTVMVS